jgi:hypothetical protein
MGYAAPGSSRRSEAGRISLGLKVGDFCELFATSANWRSLRACATDCDIGLLAGDGVRGWSFWARFFNGELAGDGVPDSGDGQSVAAAWRGDAANA